MRLTLALFACSATVAVAQNMPPAEVTQGNQLIHDVAKTGTGERLKAILEKEPRMLNVRNARGATPLHLAAINPDASALAVLLAANAEVNVPDDEGYTPLHMAAFHRQAEYAVQLLEAGADIEAKSKTGRTPLSMAEKARADEVSGVLSLWILKGCKPKSGCGISAQRPVKKLLRP